MEFRQDINGLRAWAVLLVMFYHFGLPGLTGGFVGVDVFFVISGYLMTGIILSRQAQGQLSLKSFYLSRARRIVPALAVLCVAVLGFGWFWMSASDYKTLSTHTTSTVLFFSNLKFAGEAGYFDVASNEKWLLHTWSLSVEWQFYLLYPLLLVWLTRWLRLSAQIVVPGMLAGSLLYALLLSRSDPSHAFYVLPARAWELLAGGMVYLYGARITLGRFQRVWIEYAGFSLIVIAAVGIDMNHWPGPLVMVPVLGAVMVLLADRQMSILTAHPAAQALGRWSYSIYLWHWPLLVGVVYFGLPQSLSLTIVLLIASIALGATSFRYVEEPFRHTEFGRSIRWRGMLMMMLCVVAVAEAINFANGIPARLPDALARIEAQMLTKETDELKRATGQINCGWNKKTGRIVACRYGDTRVAPTIAVWGDSHANKHMLAIHEAAQHNGLGVELYYQNGCPPLQGFKRKMGSAVQDCSDSYQQTMDKLTKNAQLHTIMLIANWPNYLGSTKTGDTESKTYFGAFPLATREERQKEFVRHMADDMCALKRLIKRVVVTTPLPYFGVNVPKHMARTYISNGRAEVPSLSRQVHMARSALLHEVLTKTQAQCGVEILDLLPLFCDDTTCYGARQNIPLYSDDNHLSKHGNNLIEPSLEHYFRQVR